MANRDSPSSSTTDLEEHLLGYEKDDQEDFERIPKKLRPKQHQQWMWAVHLLMFLLNVGLALYLLRHLQKPIQAKQCSVLRDHELPWAEDIVSYEEKVFVASGFHERDDAPNTEFEGFGDPAIDRAWINLTSGIYFLPILT